MAHENWFYAVNGQQAGPLTLDALRGLLAQGRISHGDLVWGEGMPQWLEAGKVPELAGTRAAPQQYAQPGPPQQAYPQQAYTPGYAGPGGVMSYYTPSQTVSYGGFWKRFCAAFIDGIVTSILGAIVGFFFGVIIGVVMGAQGSNIDSIQEVAGVMGNILGIIIAWLYAAIMESSAKQATLGKMALGMIVTDEAGNRISFGRATGRYFAKFLSALILLIGYIMAAFTERKQALHDMIAGTLVIDRPV